MSWQTELLGSLAANHPELVSSGFAHAANVGELKVETPYELADGLQIRKAHPNEIATLKNLLLATVPLPPLIPTRNPYETEAHSVETKPGTVSFSASDLPEDKWRYHVIAFQGTNAKLHDFVGATTLSRFRLTLGPAVLASPALTGPAFLLGPATGRLWEELSHSDAPFLRLGSTELEDLRLVHRKVTAFKEDRVGLRSAMNRFEQLDAVPKGSPLRFLGYVSVLESIITHLPDPKDPYDSLTRQVRQKMLLLGHRSVIPIPYEVFGARVNPGTVWTRLYDYRSRIAHGATPDFKGGLQYLKDPATALEFISRATVAVMRQALEEPDLISDLRAC